MSIRGGCLTDSQAAPQTHGVWLWFKLGHRGRSLLAVLWQYKEINICKGYWYMSRQWHGVRLDMIFIRDFMKILDIDRYFTKTNYFSVFSFSFRLYWVGFLCNSNTELVTWSHVTFPIDRHFCGLFHRACATDSGPFLLQVAPSVCI